MVPQTVSVVRVIQCFFSSLLTTNPSYYLHFGKHITVVSCYHVVIYDQSLNV